MTTLTATGFYGEDIDVELPYNDEGGIAEDTFECKLIGRYLACWCMYHDDFYSSDYFEEYENGELLDQGRGPLPGRYDGKRMIYFDPDDEKRQWFSVDKYDHSRVHYSLANSRRYPDRQRAASTGIVYVPPDDLQKQYNKDKYKKGGKVAAREKLEKYAAAVLENYTDWCNGEVYGLCSWVADAKTGEKVNDEDACWGFIGYDYAKEELKEFEADAIVTAQKLESETRLELVKEQKQAGINFLELFMGQVGQKFA